MHLLATGLGGLGRWRSAHLSRLCHPMLPRGKTVYIPSMVNINLIKISIKFYCDNNTKDIFGSWKVLKKEKNVKKIVFLHLVSS